MKKQLIVFVIAIAIFFPSAFVHAEPMQKGKGGTLKDGGVNVFPYRLARSMGELTEASNFNLQQIVTGLGGLIGQASSNQTAAMLGQTALAGYGSVEGRISSFMNAGVNLMKDLVSPMAPGIAMGLSGSSCVAGGLGETPRLVMSSFNDVLPNHSMKKFGAGGRAAEAHALLIDGCRNKAFDQKTAEELTKTGKYGTCESGPFGGAFQRPSIFLTQAEDLKIDAAGGGTPETQALQFAMRVMDFGGGVEAAIMSRNLKSVGDLMVAEAEELGARKYASEGGYKKAVFHPGESQSFGKDLLLRVEARTHPEWVVDTYRSIARAAVAGPNQTAFLSAISPYAGTKSRGGGTDSCKYAKTMYAQHTKNKLPTPDGYLTSKRADGMYAMAVNARMGFANAGEVGPPSQSAGNVALSQIGAEMAKTRVTQNDRSVGAATAAIEGSLTNLAAVISSPQYQTFLASIDDKYVNEVVAEVKKLNEENNVQLAMNMEMQFRKDMSIKWFAENDPRIKKQPTQMALADVFGEVGVDVDHLMPMDTGGQKVPMYASLFPTLLDQVRDTSGLTLIAQKGNAQPVTAGVALADFAKEAMVVKQ